MITQYETSLVAHLLREMEPKRRMSSLSMKTDPLSDECKEEIRTLSERRGFRVEFPVEEVLGTHQHFVRAFAVKTG